MADMDWVYFSTERTGRQIQKMNKYRNKKTVYEGIKFASMGEAQRYAELRLLERAGCIVMLETQKTFVLQPGFICNDKKVRPITYIADFYYYNKDIGKYIVEDYKGMETDVFKIKWKMLKFLHSDKYIYIKSGRKP